MKEILLTQNKVALVDDEDYEYLNQWNWYALKNRNTYYAQRTKTINGKECAIKMHRIIMNTPDDLEVDHIDHNGLNCQKYNMRNCTFEQNRKNRNHCGKSKYKGVSFTSYNKPFSRIKVNGKLIHLGVFDSEINAAKAYNEAAKKYYGEYANLNIIN